jgi:N-acetylmuramoyl-L-alanine amidase
MDHQYLVIHCAATRPSQDISAEDIDRWHKEKGFDKIGYHYFIKRNGNIENGRLETETGAHAYGYNSKSLGICLAGGVTEDNITVSENNFTKEQFESLDRLVEQIEDTYLGIKVIGHNEISQKDCPGFNVQEWLNGRN